MRTAPKPVSHIEAGDMVDLTTCPVHRDDPRASSFYGRVEGVHSAGDRVVVVYANFGLAEYRHDQDLSVCVPWTPALAAEVAARKAAEPDRVFEDRYEVFESKGVVVDRTTGLMWKRAAEDARFTFDGAQEHAKAVNSAGGFAGHADWRVPTREELLSIVDPRFEKPAVHPEAFPGTPPTWFWSSSPIASDASDPWNVSFNNGNDYWNSKNNAFRVRLVRAGQ